MSSINIKIDIDPFVNESEVIIRVKEETELVREVVSFIRQRTEPERFLITACRDNIMMRIDQQNIIRIYTEDRKIVVWTRDGDYQVRGTLQDLEKALNDDLFIRISRFEIINLNWVSGFDYSIKNTIKVIYEDGSYSWVSRRFVRSVEQRLAKLAQAGGKSNE